MWSETFHGIHSVLLVSSFQLSCLLSGEYWFECHLPSLCRFSSCLLAGDCLGWKNRMPCIPLRYMSTEHVYERRGHWQQQGSLRSRIGRSTLYKHHWKGGLLYAFMISWVNHIAKIRLEIYFIERCIEVRTIFFYIETEVAPRLLPGRDRTWRARWLSWRKGALLSLPRRFWWLTIRKIQ